MSKTRSTEEESLKELVRNPDGTIPNPIGFEPFEAVSIETRYVDRTANTLTFPLDHTYCLHESDWPVEMNPDLRVNELVITSHGTWEEHRFRVTMPDAVTDEESEVAETLISIGAKNCGEPTRSSLGLHVGQVPRDKPGLCPADDPARGRLVNADHVGETRQRTLSRDLEVPVSEARGEELFLSACEESVRPLLVHLREEFVLGSARFQRLSELVELPASTGYVELVEPVPHFDRKLGREPSGFDEGVEVDIGRLVCREEPVVGAFQHFVRVDGLVLTKRRPDRPGSPGQHLTEFLRGGAAADAGEQAKGGVGERLRQVGDVQVRREANAEPGVDHAGHCRFGQVPTCWGYTHMNRPATL